MYTFLAWIEFVLWAKVYLIVVLFSLKKEAFYIINLFPKSRRNQNTSKTVKWQKQVNISSKIDAVTFKLQLHFSLPCEQLSQGPRPLTDWENILSSPHCSWQLCSCVASRIFNLTRLFLSGSGREQGSCQFESWVHTWQSQVDRHSRGRCHVHAIRALVTWASPHLPNNSTGFKLSHSERASLLFSQLICFWHKISLLLSF